MKLPRIAGAALTYFAAIFALGFVLGAGRTMWLAPRIGETPAVLCELPLMLAASWLAARHITRRRKIASTAEAATMGALAFALLMAAELLLPLALGTSAAEWLAGLGRMPGLLGLAGQVAFGVMPLVVWVRR